MPKLINNKIIQNIVDNNNVHNRRQYRYMERFSIKQIRQIRKMIKPFANAYSYHTHRITPTTDLLIATKSNDESKMVFTKYNEYTVAYNHRYSVDDDTQIAATNDLNNKTLLSMTKHYAKLFGVTYNPDCPNNPRGISFAVMFNHIKDLPIAINNMAEFMTTIDGLSQTFSRHAVDYYKLHHRCGYLK